MGGAISGFRSFTSAITDGARVPYAIVGVAEWEIGDGVFTAAGTTLTRENVYSSSNGNALVNFSAGTKNVWVDLPAQQIANIGLVIAMRNLWVPQ